MVAATIITISATAMLKVKKMSSTKGRQGQDHQRQHHATTTTGAAMAWMTLGVLGHHAP
jgi:hypothetical protein